MIELFTSPTPNGYKISIMLEECGIPYSFKHIELGAKEQKQDWFLKMNPNGRIPVIVDHDNDDFVVFESGAILIYLAELTGQFFSKDKKQHSKVLQWLMFQTGGLGPMQGQAHVFYRYAPEKIPYAIKRYQKEARRLYEVLDGQLQDRAFLVDDLSIADFAAFPWVRRYDWAGVPIEDLPNLWRWFQLLNERPAVQRALDVPVPQAELSRRSVQDKVEQIQRII